MANGILPIIGMFAYHEKFCGNVHKISPIGTMFAKKALIIFKALVSAFLHAGINCQVLHFSFLSFFVRVSLFLIYFGNIDTFLHQMSTRQNQIHQYNPTVLLKDRFFLVHQWLPGQAVKRNINHIHSIRKIHLSSY